MKILAFAFVFICFSHSSYCQQQPNKTDSTESEVFTVIETQAEFPGGLASLKAFIEKNLAHPKKDVEGKVFVSFVVNVDGSLSNFEVIKGLCEECDKNAVDVLKKMPKWTPAKQNGRIIKSRFVLPISYTK